MVKPHEQPQRRTVGVCDITQIKDEVRATSVDGMGQITT